MGVPALAGRARALLPAFGAEGERRFGAPYLAIHRADLLRVLADAVPDGVVELGRHVTGVDGDRFVFEDGSRRSRSTR